MDALVEPSPVLCKFHLIVCNPPYIPTAEPTDDMMEVAIEAMNRVIPENENEDNW